MSNMRQPYKVGHDDYDLEIHEDTKRITEAGRQLEIDVRLDKLSRALDSFL